MENILFFPVIISTEKENNEKYYNVFVPTLEVNTEGESIGDCIRMARDAILQKCMEYIIKNKELPVFNIKEIDSIEHSKNEIVTLVDVDYNEVKKKCDTRVLRRSVSIPAYIDNYVKENNINVSAFLTQKLKKEYHI